MPKKETVNTSAFNKKAQLPYQLRLKDFEIAMQDVYDFFYDVNLLFTEIYLAHVTATSEKMNAASWVGGPPRLTRPA